MAERFLLLPNEPAAGEAAGLTPLEKTLLRPWLACSAETDSETTEDDRSAWRGLAAFVLLADTFPDCSLTVERLTPETSPLTAAALRVLGRSELQIVRFSRGGQTGILGLADAERVILPAAQAAELRSLIPAEVGWFHPGEGFLDPVSWLSERERALLLDRLRHFGTPEARRLQEDLRAAGPDAAALSDPDALRTWQTQVQAIALLSGEADMTPLTREDRPLPLGGNALLAALGLISAAPSLPPDTVWRWRDVPFARACAALGVESIPGAGQETTDALEELRAELRALRLGSARFASQAAARLESWISEREGALALEAILLLRDEVSGLRRIPVAASAQPVFRWPLDSASPALRIVLGEHLGEKWAALALNAFADVLTLVPDGQLGDPAMDACFALQDGSDRLTALLPISDAVAEATARGEGGEGVVPAQTRLSLQADRGVEVSLLLRGEGEVRLVRVYPPEEQLRLSEPPFLSLWPAAALPPEAWRLYLVSLRGPGRIRCLRGGRWAETSAQACEHAVLSTETCPRVLSLHLSGRCLGALMCQPAETVPPAGGGTAVGAVDFGASALKLAFRFGGQSQPLSLPPLWRILLRNDRDFSGERLPVYPPEAQRPAWALLWREAAPPFPYLDGRSAAPDEPGAMPAGGWAPGGEAEASPRWQLLVQEGLLQLCLAAALQGADSLQPRLTLPGGLPLASRQRMTAAFEHLAAGVGRACGVSVQLRGAAVDRALCACLSAKRQLPAQSFLLADIGAGAAELSLCLRGMERPALSLPTGDGVTALLASCFALRPDWLRDELLLPSPHVNDETWLRVCAQAERAAAGADALLALRQSLDELLGPRLPATAARISEVCTRQGRPSRIQALLLLGFSLQLTCCGMALERLRWNGSLSGYLPPEMPLMLCGRGATLLNTFDDQLRWQLSRFPLLALSQGHPTRSLPWLFPALPGLEAALGAVEAQAIALPPVMDSLDSSESAAQTALRFLSAFQQAFPAAAAQLFPGLIEPGGYPAPYAESLLCAIAEQAASQPLPQLVERLLLELLRG